MLEAVKAITPQAPPTPAQTRIDRNSSSLSQAWLQNIPAAPDGVCRTRASPWCVWGTAVCLGGGHLPARSAAVGISLYSFIQPQTS